MLFCLHILVSIMVTSSPGLAFCWDRFPVASCLHGLLFLLPLSANILPNGQKALYLSLRTLIFKEASGGCVQIPQDFSTDPGPLAKHIPLQKSHPQLGSCESSLFTLLSPTSLSLHPYVMFKSQTRQDSNFFASPCAW